MKHIIEGMDIKMACIDHLLPYKYNARMHSKKQIQQIANSIKAFGFMNPVLVDSKQRILAGHGRVEAAKKLGMKDVPIIISDHLSEDQMRSYILADNRIAQNAGWDKEMLSIELQHLSNISVGSDLDIELTGFAMAEIDQIIEPVSDDNESIAEEDVIPLMPDKHISRHGDIWVLGNHLLVCGDSLDASSYRYVFMRDEKAHMIFSDPPYNVPVSGHICGNGAVQHDEFAFASGEMSKQEFLQFLTTVFGHMHAYSHDGSLHYLCMDWRSIDLLLHAGHSTYDDLKNICIWNKDNGGMGSLYRSKHEMIAVFKKGNVPHINNIELGKYGRYRTNVWDYKGVNSFGQQQADLKLHPTVKPVAMIADAIKDCTHRGHIVLDSFAGSGSTLIAAEKTGRQARCIEYEPKYCDVIIRRWEELTGEEAYHMDTFCSFDEMASYRGETS